MEPSQLDADIVTDILVHLFDPLLPRPRVSTKSLISPKLTLDFPFLPPASIPPPLPLVVTDSAEPDDPQARSPAWTAQSLSIFRLPSLVVNALPGASWTFDVTEASQFTRQYRRAEWVASVEWRLKVKLFGWTIVEKVDTNSVRLHFSHPPPGVARSRSKGKKKRRTSMDQVSQPSTQKSDTLAEQETLVPQENVHRLGESGVLLSRVDYGNTEFAHPKGSWIRRTSTLLFKRVFAQALPIIYMILLVFGLTLPKKLLPSSLYPSRRHRHHNHPRPTPKSTTSGFSRGVKLSPVVSAAAFVNPHLLNPKAGSESSDVESEYSLVSTTGTANPETITSAFLHTASFILLDINFQVSQAYLSIKATTLATYQEVVALFYALRRVVVVFVEIVLSVLGVGYSLAEEGVREGVRGAVEEGERYGREEWMREQAEKEQSEMSRSVRRERRVSNGGRSTLKSSSSGSVRSGGGQTLTKRVSFSFPGEEPSFPPHDSLIGYPSPPSSAETHSALEPSPTNDNFPDSATAQGYNTSTDPETATETATASEEATGTQKEDEEKLSPTHDSSTAEEQTGPGPFRGDRASMGEEYKVEEVIPVLPGRNGALTRSTSSFSEYPGSNHGDDTATLRALLDAYPAFSASRVQEANRSASDNGESTGRLRMGIQVPLPASPLPAVPANLILTDEFEGVSPRSTCTPLSRHSSVSDESPTLRQYSASDESPTLSPRASLFPIMASELGLQGLAPRLELSAPGETIQEDSEEGEVLDIRMRERSFDTQATAGDESEVGNEALTSIVDIDEGDSIFLTPVGASPQLTPTHSTTFEVRYSPPSPPTRKPQAIRSTKGRTSMKEDFESTDSDIGEGLMEEGPSSRAMDRGYSTLSGSTSGQTAESSAGPRTPADSPQASNKSLNIHSAATGEMRADSRGRVGYRAAHPEGEWLGSGKIGEHVEGGAAGGAQELKKTTPKKSHKQQKRKASGKSKS